MAPKITPSSPNDQQPSDQRTADLPLAIVIPWFGRGHNGGAEMHAWQLAARLAARGRAVEVITTCCRSFQDDWGVNHLAEGISSEPEGFTVRRFPVAPRDTTAFDRVNGTLLGLGRDKLRPGLPPIGPEDEAIFADDLIKSPALIEYLGNAVDHYHGFLFLPYLYGTTLRGVPSVAAKAFLQPCLHDEAYAYLPLVFSAFYSAKAVLCLSDGEAELAYRLMGPGVRGKTSVTGAGVDAPVSGEDPSLLAPLGDAPFILCLGRQDAGKNTDLLVRAYAEYRRQNPESRLHLVLAGPGTIPMPDDCPGLLNFGPVPELQKNALLARCLALFHPSKNESYSRVLMEAWRAGHPVAAHPDCLATATAVTRASGGWLAGTEQEWTALFATVANANATLLDMLGNAGRTYATRVADWDQVMDRYEEVLWPAPATSVGCGSPATVHQILPNFVYGDAICNHTRFIRNTLRRLGHSSEIYALDTARDVAHETVSLREQTPPPDSALIYHHSIGTAVTDLAVRHPGPKCLIYHNITPEDFLAPYLPLHASLSRQGREQLPHLAPHFPHSVGDSAYNAIELADAGFANPGVLPICVDPAKWQEFPDPTVTAAMTDGRTNILFVGRLCPNKKQEDLIFAFSQYKRLDPTARLVLVGNGVLPDDLYSCSLRELATRLGVGADVVFTGGVNDAQLIAYYRNAHLFWSMSEHEGFCVPLIEAMWFDVPVFAFSSSAVPETLAGAGVLFETKDDIGALCEKARSLVRDPRMRAEVLAKQRVRRDAFLPVTVGAKVADLLHDLLPQQAPEVADAAPAPLPPDTIKTIAVVKLDHIGDLVLATPVFAALRRRFPAAQITAVVAPGSAPILKGNPNVDDVVTFEAPWLWRVPPTGAKLAARLSANAEAQRTLLARHFDLVVNLRSDHQNVPFAASLPHRLLLSYTNDSAYSFLITHPLQRTVAMHAVAQHRHLLASIDALEWSDPAVYPSDEDRAAVDAVYQFTPGTVALFTGAGVPLKRWPAVKFMELARRIAGVGVPMVLLGTADEAPLAEEIAARTGATNLCSRFTLLQLAEALRRCAVLVSNDSAPDHIAAAMGTPVVCITRPLVREEFAPVGEHHQLCSADRCDRPCTGFDPVTRSQGSPVCRCIAQISVDDVLTKTMTILRTTPALASTLASA